MTNQYDRGDQVRITATFTNSTGTAVDPDTIIFEYKDPSNVTSTLAYSRAELVKKSTGVYYADVSLDESGTWYIRAYGTGSAIAATPSSLEVREDEF